MRISVNSIPFSDFLDGTIQIAITFLIIAIIIIGIFVSNVVNKLTLRLNKNNISNESSKFKIIYILLALSIIFTVLTIVFISIRNIIPDTDFLFYIFAALSFFFLPLSLGTLPVMFYVLHRKQFQWGNLLLLLLFFCIMVFMGTNIHDLIWCYERTNGLQVENLAGRDLRIFFTLFGITDKTQWDYRTFFFYIAILVFIEILTAILVFVKFVKINIHERKKSNILGSIFIVLMIIAVNIVNGIFIFIIDQPFNYSYLIIRLVTILGIPLVAVLLILSSFLMSKYLFQNEIETLDEINIIG